MLCAAAVSLLLCFGAYVSLLAAGKGTLVPAPLAPPPPAPPPPPPQLAAAGAVAFQQPLLSLDLQPGPEALPEAVPPPPDWAYWENCAGAVCEPLPPLLPAAAAAGAEGQYLLFEGWGAGFNNERMSLELAWALVRPELPHAVPGPDGWDLLMGSSDGISSEHLIHMGLAPTGHLCVCSDMAPMCSDCSSIDTHDSTALVNTFVVLAGGRNERGYPDQRDGMQMS